MKSNVVYPGFGQGVPQSGQRETFANPMKQPAQDKRATMVNLGRPAFGNDHLVAAWKGRPDENRLYCSGFDGSNWAPQQVVPGGASGVLFGEL